MMAPSERHDLTQKRKNAKNGFWRLHDTGDTPRPSRPQVSLVVEKQNRPLLTPGIPRIAAVALSVFAFLREMILLASGARNPEADGDVSAAREVRR